MCTLVLLYYLMYFLGSIKVVCVVLLFWYLLKMEKTFGNG